MNETKKSKKEEKRITNMIIWYFLDCDSKENGFYQSNKTNHNTQVIEIFTQLKPIVFYIEHAQRFSTPFEKFKLLHDYWSLWENQWKKTEKWKKRASVLSPSREENGICGQKIHGKIYNQNMLYNSKYTI